MKASILAASILVVGATFLAASAVQAAPQKARPAPKASHSDKAPVAPTAKAAEKGSASGTVEKFDQGSRTLVLKHDGKELTFVLGDGASVMAGSQKAALTDIAAGRKAKVEYTLSNGAKTVSLVELERAPAKAAKATPKK